MLCLNQSFTIIMLFLPTRLLSKQFTDTSMLYKVSPVIYKVKTGNHNSSPEELWLKRNNRLK